MAVERDGRVIAGRYRLTRAIGRGGMGVVWAAADRRLGREVAVKELLVNPAMSDDQNTTLLHRAMREGRIAAALDHPAVVTVYDTFMFDDRPWIVMELLRGASLAQMVARNGPLTPERAAAVGVPLLSALRAAHAAGIVHRDVKPGNVLLADDGRVVLTDFGLAAVEGDPSLTQAGMVMGSPPYVAPERARGAPATPAADLWSLGATLFMAIEGAGPYDRDTPIAALGALVTEEPPPARNAGPLRPLVEGLLTRDPQRRLDPETAAELLRRVAESDNSPHAAPTPSPTAENPTPPIPTQPTGSASQPTPTPPPQPTHLDLPVQATAPAQPAAPTQTAEPAQPARSARRAWLTLAGRLSRTAPPGTTPSSSATPAPADRRGLPARPALHARRTTAPAQRTDPAPDTVPPPEPTPGTPDAAPGTEPTPDAISAADAISGTNATPAADAPPGTDARPISVPPHPLPGRTRAQGAGPRGSHAAPEGAPRSALARGAAWIGRHRAPAKLTAVSTVFALVASVAGWNALRDRGESAAPSPAPATSGGPTHDPRPSAHRHPRTYETAGSVTVLTTPSERHAHRHRHHHTDARTPDRRHTPAATRGAEPHSTARHTPQRGPGGDTPPRVIPALPRQ